MKNICQIIISITCIFLLSCSQTSVTKNTNQSDQKLADYDKTIVAFGDSLTAGYQLTPNQSYPSQLQDILHDNGYHHWQVINSGVSGDTTSAGLNRLEWMLESDPDIVIIGLGANDGLRGITPDITKKNLDAIIQTILDNNSKVILAGMKLPENLGPEFLANFESLYPQLAKKHDIPLIGFLLEGVAGKKDLNLKDGIHPNQEGYQIVANNVWYVLQNVVE